MKITIPEPCKEDWGTLTPESKGRFCTTCEKIVVDFTKMGKMDILNYFEE